MVINHDFWLLAGSDKMYGYIRVQLEVSAQLEVGLSLEEGGDV